MANSIHGKITNSARSDFGEFSGAIQVFASGRAYEIVERNGIHVHSAWFDAANLGTAAHNQEALKDYLSTMLLTIVNEEK